MVFRLQYKYRSIDVKTFHVFLVKTRF